MGAPHRYYPPQFIGTFNANGVLTGTIDLVVDDNTMTTSVTQPLVIPYTAHIITLFTSFGILTGSPTYDLNIYLNGGLETTLSLTSADEQAAHVLDISVVEADEISMDIVNTHGTPASNNFEDLVAELST